MTTQVFQRPETVPIWTEWKTWAGALHDPTHGVTLLYLIDPKGITRVENQPMAKDPLNPETGKYVYYYDSSPKDTPPVDDEPGWWRYKAISQDGVGGDAKYVGLEGAFELK
ncbi:hypothetical protein ES704_01801 [subsurface metagenome]|jgi:hypothetical protein